MMVICSYLVVAVPGAAASLARCLAALPGCEVVPAENRDVLLLVTESADAEADSALRSRIAALEDVRALVLTFGNIAATEAPSVGPTATEHDVATDAASHGRRALPVVRTGPSA